MTMEQKIIVPSLIVPDGNRGIDFDATSELFKHISKGIRNGLKYAEAVTGDKNSSKRVKTGFLLFSATTNGFDYPADLAENLVGMARSADRDALVAITAWETKDKRAVDYVKAAIACNADYVFLPLPIGKQVNQYEYVDDIADAIDGRPSLVLYENPGLTKGSYEIATISRLVRENKIQGIKDSNSDANHFKRVLDLDGRFERFLGSEELFDIFLYEDEYRGKLAGIVPSTANPFPEFIGALMGYYVADESIHVKENIRSLQLSHILMHGTQNERKYDSLLYLLSLRLIGGSAKQLEGKLGEPTVNLLRFVDKQLSEFYIHSQIPL